MGDRDHVEMGDAAGPEIRRDHIFAEIELRAAAPDRSAGIDEQSAALRRDQQDGVSFAYVDGSDFENSSARLRLRGKDGERERCDQQCNQPGDREQRTTARA